MKLPNWLVSILYWLATPLVKLLGIKGGVQGDNEHNDVGYGNDDVDENVVEDDSGSHS